jgi:hypothetical protein
MKPIGLSSVGFFNLGNSFYRKGSKGILGVMILGVASGAPAKNFFPALAARSRVLLYVRQRRRRPAIPALA